MGRHSLNQEHFSASQIVVSQDFRLAVLPGKRALSACWPRTCSRCRLLGSQPVCRNASGALGQGAPQGEEGAARRGGASALLPAPVSSWGVQLFAELGLWRPSTSIVRRQVRVWVPRKLGSEVLGVQEMTVLQAVKKKKKRYENRAKPGLFSLVMSLSTTVRARTIESWSFINI